MSQSVNPVTVGGFVIGAIALLISGIFIFGGRSLLNNDVVRYVTYFDSSLNGLELGAPVKMQGVKIGVVSEIALQVDPVSGKVYKPVVLEIERNSFIGPDGSPLPIALSESQQRNYRNRLVEAGFRARLEMQSLLTGLLYVDLDLHPYKTAEFMGMRYKGLLEMPSIPTTTDEIRNTLDELFDQLRELPLKKIVTDLSETLEAVRSMLMSDEARDSRKAVAATLKQTEVLISRLNGHLDPLLKTTQATLEETRAVLQHSQGVVNELSKQAGPLLETTRRTLETTEKTLNKAGTTFDTLTDTLDSESALQASLLSLRDAARSLQALTDLLERQPEALIRGKQ
ncbi:MCE family protein [Candidatus Woesearchaeota archaeon]|nr:MCE family protein [Candidatus Woesearchaeota archaeon]